MLLQSVLLEPGRLGLNLGLTIWDLFGFGHYLKVPAA